jgi:hypothetical protein
MQALSGSSLARRGVRLSAVVGLGLLLGLLASTGAVRAADRLVIADDAGRPVLVYMRDGTGIAVTDGSDSILLRGERSGADRTIYRLPDGSTLGTVKWEGERFKLVAPDGRLLRKVKRDGDRIKISDNEQNAGAAELIRRGDDKWELEVGERSLGKAKPYPDQGKIKVKDSENRVRYELAGTPLTPAPLVLLIPGLPADQAQALMAEIWLKSW